VDHAQRFELLRALYAEIRRDKDAAHFRNPNEWLGLIPDEIKSRFTWPTTSEREYWLAVRGSTPIAVPDLSRQLGATWDFYRVFEAIEEGEYDVLECETISDGVAEMRIDPHAYPYGGVGPLIALAEAFGFTVVAINEHGTYQTRAELLGGKENS
jgi:hypothetical protein